MVHIQYKDGTEGHTKLCGGVIIGSKWVLTAAHCVKKIDLEDCVDCISAYVGLYDFRSHYSLEAHRTMLKIKRIIMHEDFSQDNLEHDIALLEVGDISGEPLDLEASAYVRNICLPEGEVTPPGTKCFLAGWGYTESDEASRYLREVDLDVRDIDECTEIYEKVDLISLLHPRQNLCAGEVGKDACHGDSGGPLMCQRCDSCNWYVAGVVSYGKDCGKYPGVYTNVAEYESWIRQAADMAPLTTKKMRGCKECCKYMKISGTDKQQSRHGYYEKQDLDYNNQATYRQMYTGDVTNYIWFLGAKYSLWFVSTGLGDQKTGGLLTKTQTKCPAQSTSWLLYDQEEEQPWVDAPDLEVECLESKPSPEYTEWTEWSVCTAKCEGGLRQRSRVCQYAASADSCVGEAEQEEECNDMPCSWAPWSEWTEDLKCSVGCGRGGSKRRHRTCPVEDCVGDAEEEEECDVVPCPYEDCCATMTYTNNKEPKFNGTYYMMRDLHGGLPAWTNKEQNYFIYFTPDYLLWITNPTRENGEARSYADGSQKNACPAEFDTWMYYSDGGWSLSDTTMECQIEWSEWTSCDCKTKQQTRHKKKEKEQRSCACAKDDYTWLEWGECEQKETCAERTERKREMTCSPFCQDILEAEMTETEECVQDGCESECCTKVKIENPDSIRVSESFLVDYVMVPSETSYPIYEGTTKSGEKRYLYFFQSYKMWVAALKMGDASNAALYKDSRTACPENETEKNWRVHSQGSWTESFKFRFVCDEPLTTKTTSEPTTGTTPEPITAAQTTTQTTPSPYTPWSEWTTDCGKVECGTWINERERECESVTVCEDTLERRECTASKFSLSEGKEERTVANDTPIKCPSECCNLIQVTIPEGMQSHRSGLYYQRDQLIDGKPSYTNGKKSFMYFVKAWNAWIVHNNLNPTEAALYTKDKADCPNMLNGWSIYERKWVKGDVSMTCVSVPEVLTVDENSETTTAEQETKTTSESTTSKQETKTTSETTTATSTTITTTTMSWSEWSECSATCDGIKMRYKGEDQFGNRQQEYCGGRCPYWETWESWSQCSKSCGSGSRKRMRQCLSAPNKKTDGCEGGSEESVVCNEEECLDFPCCQYVTVSTTSKSFEYRTGVYKIQNEQVNDRYVYKLESGASLIFSTRSTYWLIGDDSAKESGNAYAKGTDPCPTDSNGWNQWDGHTWKPFEQFSITCGSDWSEWSLCSATCGGGSQSRSRYSASGELEREEQQCSTNECTDCAFSNENENCEQWGDQGYCSTKFVKFMQKKCRQSCCERGELKQIKKQEERTLFLCDKTENIFNDDYTAPPLNEWDELLANEVTCENYHEIKMLWQMDLVSRSVNLKSPKEDDPAQHLNTRMAFTAQDHLDIGLGGAY